MAQFLSKQDQFARNQIRFFIVLLILALICALAFPRISVPMGIAYIGALMLRPYRSRFWAGSPLQKTMMVLALILLLFLLALPFISMIATAADDLVRLPDYYPRLEGFFREKIWQVKSFLSTNMKIKMQTDLGDVIFGRVQKEAQKLFVVVPKALGVMLEWAFLVPLFFYFFMREGEASKRVLLRYIPNQIFERAYILFHQFNRKFGDYIVAKAIEATIVGVLITVGLWSIGFPYAALFGLFGGVTNILPYIGPIIGYAPALIIAMSDPQAGGIGPMSMVYLVANVIDMVLVFPLLVSKIVNLHPIVVICSVIMGGQMGGVVGMLISVPVAAFLKLVFAEIAKGFFSNKDHVL